MPKPVPQLPVCRLGRYRGACAPSVPVAAWPCSRQTGGVTPPTQFPGRAFWNLGRGRIAGTPKTIGPERLWHDQSGSRPVTPLLQAGRGQLAGIVLVCMVRVGNSPPVSSTGGRNRLKLSDACAEARAGADSGNPDRRLHPARLSYCQLQPVPGAGANPRATHASRSAA